ncbi:MAG: hypothetical protein GX605_07780, partial [Chloroflexi bacterium]|nr:hypothetical protein [Chloroflexota bacterium]
MGRATDTATSLAKVWPRARRAASTAAPLARRLDWLGRALLLAALLVLAGASSIPGPQLFDFQVNAVTGPYRFDLARWELQGLVAKFVFPGHLPTDALTSHEQEALVQGYFALTG